jgi:phospholipase C
MSHIGRRRFLKMMGMTAAMSTVNTTIAKALATPANNRTGTINDVEHIVILMQENRPFDHHFGTLAGVRGFNDPRAVNIHLPLQTGPGSTPAPVFLQPAGAANVTAGFSVPPGTVGGPADGVDVIPPFRVNPESISPGLKSLGLTYFPGTNHSWDSTHLAWNQGQYDNWAIKKGPIAMSYMTREDIPYHYALADAFTVGDAYYHSAMAPTNPNRIYQWTGCIGNLSNLGPGGTDDHGAGPVTANGLSPNNALYVFPTFPEVLQAAGVSWRIYQDLAGSTGSPDFGDGTGNNFAGNFGDNTLLYFNQYQTATAGMPLFDNAVTGTDLLATIPTFPTAPDSAWLAWAESQFDQFRDDVNSGNLPQVSWIVAPFGYCEHPALPIDYGAWYISQVLDILVSKPDVFSKTVFIVTYDEADGSFDHIVPPTTPQAAPADGDSTVSIENEIVTNDPSGVNGPIGLATRVPFIAISPWSKGGFVNSQVFDHTSLIRFIEKRFGVFEPNISPWRRAVAGDLTSVFNFANPNDNAVNLLSTDGFVPPPFELNGGNVNSFQPTLDTVIVGVPAQEKGIRPARALPYELDAQASVDTSNGTVVLTFLNTGSATVVFQVRSGNPADPVRNYTVEPGKTLAGVWNAASSYNLSVYGPNGFVRYFNGSVGPSAAVLDVHTDYGNEGGRATIQWKISNAGGNQAEVSVLDTYTGNVSTRLLHGHATFVGKMSLDQFFGWYDLIVTVAGDPTFRYRLAGHVETGQASFSDPVLGGLVTLKG